MRRQSSPLGWVKDQLAQLIITVATLHAAVQNLPVDKSVTTTKVYRCRVCKKAYQTYSGMYSHRTVKHRRRS